MAKKSVKVSLLVAVCGGMAAFGGCLPSGWWQTALWDGALDVGWSFLLDNDAVFDLFQDDFGTGTLYDDRFTAAPTRAEPE